MAKLRLNIKKGDTVMVLSGRDKGRRGKVIRVSVRDSVVTVEGINVRKRHSKPTKTAPQGGVIDKACPVPTAKVMVVCPKCNRPTRVARSVAPDGELIRVCKECKAELDK